MTSHDPFNDRRLTRYDFDEAYIQSCLETIAYDNQQIADADERERKAKRLRLKGDLAGVDAATDDTGFANLNPTVKSWLDQQEYGI